MIIYYAYDIYTCKIGLCLYIEICFIGNICLEFHGMECTRIHFVVPC